MYSSFEPYECMEVYGYELTSLICASSYLDCTMTVDKISHINEYNDWFTCTISSSDICVWNEYVWTVFPNFTRECALLYPI